MDILSASLLLAGSLAVLAIIGVPIGLALAASGAAYIFITNGVLPVSGGIMTEQRHEQEIRRSAWSFCPNSFSAAIRSVSAWG